VSEESTTPDLVQLWQQRCEAFNRRDLDATLWFYAPDAVLDVTRTVGITAEGSAAIRSFYEDWLAAYEELTVALEEPVDLGNGVTFAITRQDARLLGSTGYVQQREGVIAVWVDGLMTRHVFRQDIGEARAAAERLAEERG
jgi:ketosteroid isomerase-like protein